MPMNRGDTPPGWKYRLCDVRKHRPCYQRDAIEKAVVRVDLIVQSAKIVEIALKLKRFESLAHHSQVNPCGTVLNLQFTKNPTASHFSPCRQSRVHAVAQVPFGNRAIHNYSAIRHL